MEHDHPRVVALPGISSLTSDAGRATLSWAERQSSWSVVFCFGAGEVFITKRFSTKVMVGSWKVVVP